MVATGNTAEEKPTNYSQGIRSPVVEDTLSDIDEAITEISNSRQRRTSRRHSSMQSTVPARALTPAEEEVIEDSSSEYSRHEEVESNSNSEFEDDEEEDEADEPGLQGHGGLGANDQISEAVIKAWTPYQVSQYLQSRNIPKVTCQKFEDEEVTGATLLQLEMSHLKELDIGSFGKRFEVWKEIESLVKKAKTGVPVKQRSGSDARLSTSSFMKDTGPRQRSSTVTGAPTGTVLPRIPSQHNRTVSRTQRINIHDANLLDVTVPGHGPLHTPMPSTINTKASSTPPPTGVFEAPRSPPISPPRQADAAGNYRRTSASKRLSGHDLSPATALNTALTTGTAVLSAGRHNSSHQRGESFDRNWSIPALALPTGARTPEQGHKVSTSAGTGDTVFTADSGFSGSQPYTPKVTERSYFSSGESTPRERKVLQKKNGGNHARKGSYTEEQRLRSATAHSRQSRLGSAGSTIETARKPSPIVTAAQAYHARGNSKDKNKRVSASFTGGPEGFPYDIPRLSPSSSTKGSSSQKKASDDATIGFAISPSTPPPVPGTRSLSEQLTPHGDSGLGGRSFGSLDGSTPSISATVESDPLRGTPERPPKADRTMSAPGRRIRGVSSGTALRTKSKKHHTSAWEKGLREVTPQQAAEQADYSGWMKKRGSSGLGVWKPRFFVLQGRRLAYFYSERDTKERGLIDITSHRVLPATEDRLVALHASFAAATSPSSSPAISATSSPQSLAADIPNGQKSPSSPPPAKEKGKEVEKDKGWFTFKLVPPAPGATKGVTFTPPKLHYFATDTREEGKKWMGAIMKATIDRDESKPVISSYNAKTISLAKARELRARPPDLLKDGDDPNSLSAALLSAGLAISGVDLGVAEEGEEADVEDGRDEVPERTESGISRAESHDSSTISTRSASGGESGEAGEAGPAGDPREAQNGDVARERGSTPSLLKSNGTVVTSLGIVA